MSSKETAEIIRNACARMAHEANRAYCTSLGDFSHFSWDQTTEDLRESTFQGVDVALKGGTPRQSHESWLAERAAKGWKYGPVKDPVAKEHPCFVPYDDLPPEQRAKDWLFVSAVRTMAEALGMPIVVCMECK